MPASTGAILRSDAITAVTAGLKCPPDVPPNEWISIASAKTWTKPMTAKSWKPSAMVLTWLVDTAIPIAKTRTIVPSSSARYADGPRRSMAAAPLAEPASGCGAIVLLRADAAELLAPGFRPAPEVDRLDAAAGDLAHR